MAEKTDDLAKQRLAHQQVTDAFEDGILQFLFLNNSEPLQKVLSEKAFQPIHPSETGARAFAIRRSYLQQALLDCTPRLSAKIADNPAGSVYYRQDMNNGDNFTVEIARDLRKVSSIQLVLCAQFTTTAFDNGTKGVTRFEHVTRPGSYHDALRRSGAFEPIERSSNSH